LIQGRRAKIVRHKTSRKREIGVGWKRRAWYQF
jgi:hypothetical protein